MADPIGIGIIGAGGISHSHLIAFTKSRTNRDLARVVAIADIDEARAREQAKTYDVEHVFTDFRDVIAHPDVQAVSICTPPFLHVEQSVEALRAGKHVLCEKPVSANLAGLDRIAEAERDAGEPIFSGVFQHRFGQGARQVKSLIERDRFGRLLFGLSETLWQRPQEYYDVWWRGTWERECGGATMGQGIHSIDMLGWLMGEPSSVFADAATVRLSMEVEDTSAATVRFQNGALGQIIVTVNAQDNRSRLEIFGERLQAVSSESAYGPTSDPFRLSSVDPGGGARAGDEAMELYPDATKNLHTPMLHDFLMATVERRRPAVTIDECRRSMQIITGMYKSAMTGERVTFPITPDDPFYSQIPPAGFGLTPTPSGTPPTTA